MSKKVYELSLNEETLMVTLELRCAIFAGPVSDGWMVDRQTPTDTQTGNYQQRTSNAVHINHALRIHTRSHTRYIAKHWSLSLLSCCPQQELLEWGRGGEQELQIEMKNISSVHFA